MLEVPDSSIISTPPQVPDSCTSDSDHSERDAEQGNDTDDNSFPTAQDGASTGEAGSRRRLLVQCSAGCAMRVVA